MWFQQRLLLLQGLFNFPVYADDAEDCENTVVKTYIPTAEKIYDECGSGLHNCPENSHCLDTHKGYSCYQALGYNCVGYGCRGYAYNRIGCDMPESEIFPCEFVPALGNTLLLLL